MFRSALLLIALGAALVAASCAFPMPDHDMSHMRGYEGWDDPLVDASGQTSVEIRGYAFHPGNLRVTAGTQVTWVNRHSVPHSATESTGAFDTGLLAQGDEATIAFDVPGIYRYRCLPHPNMDARIEVIA